MQGALLTFVQLVLEHRPIYGTNSTKQLNNLFTVDCVQYITVHNS